MWAPAGGRKALPYKKSLIRLNTCSGGAEPALRAAKCTRHAVHDQVEAHFAKRKQIEKPGGFTPVGATGNLKSRIFGEARLQPRPIVLWGTPEVYGPVVEEGRRPGSVPPPEALRPWVERKLGVPSSESKGVAFLIARAIGRRGTPGRRVFERSAPAIRRFAEKVFELKTRNMADDLNR